MRNIRAAAFAAATLALAGAAGCATDSSTPAAATTSPAAAAQQWEPPAPTAAPTTVSEPPQLSPRAIPTTPAAPPSVVAGVDRDDATAVATAAVTEWFSWRPTTDSGPLDAVARTTSLLTADYAAASLHDAPVRGPGGDFAAWAAGGADSVAVDAQPQPNQGAADTPDLRHFVFLVTQTAKKGAAPVGTAEHVVYAVARQGPQGWSVSQISTR